MVLLRAPPRALLRSVAAAAPPFASTSTSRCASITAYTPPPPAPVIAPASISSHGVRGSRRPDAREVGDRAIGSEDDQAPSFPPWDELRQDENLQQSVSGGNAAGWRLRDDELFLNDDGVDEEGTGASRWASVGEGLESEPRKKRRRYKIPPVPLVEAAPSQSTPLRYVRPKRLELDPQPGLTTMHRVIRTPWITKPRIVPVESNIHPYIPISIPTFDPVQPHENKLLSRYDWRLSAPLHQLHRDASRPTDPDSPPYPPLLFRTRPSLGYLALQGHNRLIGVGLEPALEGARYGIDLNLEERWGWKHPVDDDQKNGWSDLDSWRVKFDRLLKLTRLADELSHLAYLRRLGTPEERQEKGWTLLDAVGLWPPSTLNKPTAPGRTHRSPPVVAIWTLPDDQPIEGKLCSRLVPGDPLRFTTIDPDRDPGRPRPPPSPPKEEDPPQGTLLDIKDGKMRVSFEERWDIGDESYQIDLGVDHQSLVLQTRALDNLAFNPESQQALNAESIDAVQTKFHAGKLVTLQEVTLIGTALREQIVVGLDTHGAPLEPQATLPEMIVDDSPRIELSQVSVPAQPTLPSTTVASNPSSIFTDNQLINSWVIRHERTPPLSMPGDPELGLNDSQTRAVAMALGHNLSLIQGPPGTGKSATIVSIIHLLKAHFRVPQPILLVAPTHVSVDHLLALLVKRNLNPLRLGKLEKTREDLHRWSIHSRCESHPMYKLLEQLRSESDKARVELADEVRLAEKSKTPETHAEKLTELQVAYKLSWRKVFACEQRLFSSLLPSIDVFCATALGAGTNRILDMIDFPVVFLDEAAMCTEPVTLVPLMKGAEHFTLIGDHMQLPAIVTSQMARTERLHVSLFERLMTSQTAQTVLLDTQYRMRTGISAFPNKAFYRSALQDSPTVSERADPPRSRFYAQEPGTPGFEPTVFISHESPEATYFQSLVNHGEVDIIVDIVGDLLSKNPTLQARDIGIISPYAAQTRLLTDTFEQRAPAALKSLLGAGRAAEVDQVEINTVDGFQGREKLVIILSTVRSNKSGYIGFLTDKRRLNVALTRAQDALFVVGNAATLSMATVSEYRPADVDADAGVWRRYLTWMRERGLVRSISAKSK